MSAKRSFGENTIRENSIEKPLLPCCWLHGKFAVQNLKKGGLIHNSLQIKGEDEYASNSLGKMLF